MNRPLVVFTAFYAAGVLLGEYAGFKPSAALVLAALCLFAAAAGYVLAWRENRRVFLVLFLLLGLALSRLEVEKSRTPLVNLAGQRVLLEGRVAAEPDVREDKVFYLLQAQEIVRGGEHLAVTGAVRLSVKESNRVYGYGDVLRVNGLLSRPGPPGNPGGFDYATYLERQGIGVLLLARGEEAVQKTGAAAGNPALAAALRLKEKLSAAATFSLPPSSAAVLNGIVFGTQGLIDRDTRQAFTSTGIVHILSVSGLHVGFVLGGLLGLLRLLRLRPGLYAPLATPGLVFYAMMTGAGPAVLRATVMALLFLWAHHLGRDRDWPTTLALAALAILLWSPLQVYHPGFQLSFAATWGILYLGPVLTGLFTGLLQGLPAAFVRTAAQGLAVPLAAQLATVPLVAWYYNLISLASIPANLLAVPLVGLNLLFGVFAAVLGSLWLPLAGLVNAANGAVLDLFLALAGFFQRMPWAVVYLATPPVFLAAAWYGGLIAAVELRPGRWSADVRRKVRGWAGAGAALIVA
ncbi:MAG: ComEC family competence protein, partial [Peptococcaceae bacterium]|nr:ComEC family competence protein [Peptococcaceae bacterium]